MFRATSAFKHYLTRHTPTRNPMSLHTGKAGTTDLKTVSQLSRSIVVDASVVDVEARIGRPERPTYKPGPPPERPEADTVGEQRRLQRGARKGTV